MSSRTPLHQIEPLLAAAQAKCAASKAACDTAKANHERCSNDRDDLLKSTIATDQQILAADNARDAAKAVFIAAEATCDNDRNKVETHQLASDNRNGYLQKLKQARVPATQLTSLAERCDLPPDAVVAHLIFEINAVLSDVPTGHMCTQCVLPQNHNCTLSDHNTRAMILQHKSKLGIIIGRWVSTPDAQGHLHDVCRSAGFGSIRCMKT